MKTSHRLPGGRLDHHALPLPLAIQVNICPLDLLLVLGVDVQDLDDVGDEVGQGLVLLDLLLVLLDRLVLGLELVLESPQLRPHNPNLVVEETSPGLDIRGAHVEDLVRQILLRRVELHLKTGHVLNVSFLWNYLVFTVKLRII